MNLIDHRYNKQINRQHIAFLPSIYFAPFDGKTYSVGISIGFCQRSHLHYCTIVLVFVGSWRYNKHWHCFPALETFSPIFFHRYAKHLFNWLMTETNESYGAKPFGMLCGPDCCRADRQQICISDFSKRGEIYRFYMCKRFQMCRQHNEAAGGSDVCCCSADIVCLS